MKIYVKADSELPEDAFSPSEFRRGQIAYRTDDSGLADMYAYDPDPYVRRAAAQNPNISEDILMALSDDSDPNVRGCLAYNRSTPVDVLIKLLHDDHIEVVRAAVSCVKSHDIPPSEYVWLAGTEMAQNDKELACRIITNYTTPVEALRILMNSYINRSSDVMLSIILNKKTTTDMLELLTTDATRFKSVRKHAKKMLERREKS